LQSYPWAGPISANSWPTATSSLRVSRAHYFVAGSLLLALKFIIDRSIAARFGQSWHIWSYFFPPADLSIFGLGSSNPRLYLILWAVAIPFFWIGITLTLQRLRDAGMRLGLIFLFFVPIANLFFFLFLCFAPSVPFESSASPSVPSRGRSGAVLAGALLALAVGVMLVYFGANVLARYGFGLFLAIPFFTGFIASWALSASEIRSLGSTIAISIAVPVFIGFVLIGFRLEGIVCLLMAIPLALPFSIAGGLTARYCLSSRRIRSTGTGITACIAILPLLLLIEQSANLQPPVRSVTTSIVVDAPASVVWKDVIAFPPLAAPTELLFRSGIAYPIGAQIIGSGPGAVRYCRFSTGDFVEPITCGTRIICSRSTSHPNHPHSTNSVSVPSTRRTSTATTCGHSTVSSASSLWTITARSLKAPPGTRTSSSRSLTGVRGLTASSIEFTPASFSTSKRRQNRRWHRISKPLTLPRKIEVEDLSKPGSGRFRSLSFERS
jgi:uncharacterized membrane protein YhaH (DUF805 family)